MTESMARDILGLQPDEPINRKSIENLKRIELELLVDGSVDTEKAEFVIAMCDALLEAKE